jgi:Domain of unknown function (DUF6894)
MRFFFDYVKRDESLLDYRGDEFTNPHGAMQFAQATAQYLKHSLTEDWLDWSVEVRNAEGLKFWSVPVNTARAASA